MQPDASITLARSAGRPQVRGQPHRVTSPVAIDGSCPDRSSDTSESLRTFRVRRPTCTTDCSSGLGSLFPAPDQDTQDHDKEYPGKQTNYGNAVHCVSFLLVI